MEPWKDFCIENNLFTKSAVSVRARYREKKKKKKPGEKHGERSHEEGAMKRLSRFTAAIYRRRRCYLVRLDLNFDPSWTANTKSWNAFYEMTKTTVTTTMVDA